MATTEATLLTVPVAGGRNAPQPFPMSDRAKGERGPSKREVRNYAESELWDELIGNIHEGTRTATTTLQEQDDLLTHHFFSTPVKAVLHMTGTFEAEVTAGTSFLLNIDGSLGDYAPEGTDDYDFRVASAVAEFRIITFTFAYIVRPGKFEIAVRYKNTATAASGPRFQVRAHLHTFRFGRIPSRRS